VSPNGPISCPLGQIHGLEEKTVVAFGPRDNVICECPPPRPSPFVGPALGICRPSVSLTSPPVLSPSFVVSRGRGRLVLGVEHTPQGRRVRPRRVYQVHPVSDKSDLARGIGSLARGSWKDSQMYHSS
jgi:hypothetical protein